MAQGLGLPEPIGVAALRLTRDVTHSRKLCHRRYEDLFAFNAGLPLFSDGIGNRILWLERQNCGVARPNPLMISQFRWGRQ